MTISALAATGEKTVQYDDLNAAREAPGTTWVRAVDATDEELAAVGTTFDLHPLALEDLTENTQPKTEPFRTHTFVLLKTAILSGERTTFAEEVRTAPVGVFIGTDWLVTLSRAPSRPTDRVWRAANANGSRSLARGPAFLAYQVIDTIVDAYFEVLDELEAGIEWVEERVVADTDPDTIDAINDVRRDLLSFRKVVWPTRSAVGALVRGDSPHIPQADERYFRDVYDHLLQLVDLIETYRELTRGARDVYLNTLSQSTNDVMKTLTVVATIVLPLTLVAGIYGMNFRVMPELNWTYGYPAVLLAMALLAALLVLYFERRDYL
jgi:magnesium transporter